MMGVKEIYNGIYKKTTNYRNFLLISESIASPFQRILCLKIVILCLKILIFCSAEQYQIHSRPLATNGFLREEDSKYGDCKQYSNDTMRTRAH